LTLPEDVGKRYALHPVQGAKHAADTRPAQQARYDAQRGAFTIPARTAVVYVLP
jgi:pullulanase